MICAFGFVMENASRCYYILVNIMRNQNVAKAFVSVSSTTIVCGVVLRIVPHIV